MARALALAATPLSAPAQEGLRVLIVCGCALALICAERFIPAF
jgi:hypothetical protein